MSQSQSEGASARARLHARVRDHGPAALDDDELLELLLARACPRSRSRDAAAALLERFGSLPAVSAAAAGELERTFPLGPAAVRDLQLIQELTVRLTRGAAVGRPVISSWTALLSYVRVCLAEQPREQFRALFLDTRNRLLRDELVTHGTVDHAPVYPREVIRRALELSAAALILVHNHPSGDPTPSSADIEMTRQIVEAGRVLKIAVHDHLVVGRDGVASFKSLGLM